MKLALKNIGTGPLDISIENIRLLTNSFNRDLWDPDHPTPTEPSIVTRGDDSFTAVPANDNRFARPVTVDGKQGQTWASHWYGITLDPGKDYHIDGNTAGHVVFFLPVAQNGTVNISGVGLVSNDGTQLLGWSPVAEWPKEPTNPNDF